MYFVLLNIDIYVSMRVYMQIRTMQVIFDFLMIFHA